MSPRGKKNDVPPSVDTDTDDGTTQPAETTKPRAPKKAPKIVLEGKVEFIKAKLIELLAPMYSNVCPEFTKTVEDTQPLVEAALLITRGLADDWKPAPGKRKRKNGLSIGDFAKTKEKFLPLFKEKGFGAGPFKVLGVLPSDKTVKLVTPEGTQYVPQNQVEKVVSAEPNNG